MCLNYIHSHDRPIIYAHCPISTLHRLSTCVLAVLRIDNSISLSSWQQGLHPRRRQSATGSATGSAAPHSAAGRPGGSTGSKNCEATGLVRLECPVSLGIFSRASFAIQPRPRLRTLLDGAGPQAHGVAGMRKTTCTKLYTFRPRLLRTLTGERCRLSPATPAMRPQWPYYSVRRSLMRV